MGWFADLKSLGHTALDVGGIFPLFGNIADLGNAAWYLAEEDYENMTLSLAAATPGAGLVIGGAKLAKGATKAATAATKATQTAQKAVSVAKKSPLRAAGAAAYTSGKKAKGAAQKALDVAKDRTPGLGAPPKSALVGKAQKELVSKKELLKQARQRALKFKEVGTGGVKGARSTLTGAKAAEATAQAAATRGGRAKTFLKTARGKGFIGGGSLGVKTANVGLGVAGIHYSEQAKGAKARKKAEAEAAAKKAKEDALKAGKSEDEANAEAEKTKQGLLDKESSERRAKKGARKQRRAGEAEAERKDKLERRDFKEGQRRFDKRMALKEARLGRKEERKAASAIDEKHDIADNMRDMMGDDPNIFRNNPIQRGEYWKRARAVGVTADQFNNFIKRSATDAQRLFKEREFERESAEGRAWLNEKLDQPSLNQMGIPTPSARGRNIGRLKTGKVSPSATEVRSAVKETEEDKRKKQRSLDRNRGKIISGRGNALSERFKPSEGYRRRRAETPTTKDEGLDKERRRNRRRSRR